MRHAWFFELYRNMKQTWTLTYERERQVLVHPNVKSHNLIDWFFDMFINSDELFMHESNIVESLLASSEFMQSLWKIS